MIVVMSDQLYTIERDSANNCQILGATVRLRDAIRPDGPDVYQYVQRAVQAGSKLVIRIHPSPGDKKTIPPDATTCERKSEFHRTPEDVADEILAIHALNVAEGLPEFGFEPANEPNAEWYPPGTAPEINQTAAWREMDSYFYTVWEQVILAGGLNIDLFTPPMSQNTYAEGIDWNFDFPEIYCNLQTLDDGSTGFPPWMKAAIRNANLVSSPRPICSPMATHSMTTSPTS